jgi:uncharacterized protein GlcG (DUF336 family)
MARLVIGYASHTRDRGTSLRITLPTAVAAVVVMNLLAAPNSKAQPLDVPAALAVEAAQAAVAACLEKGYHTTAVVVGAEGVPRAMVRGDGAQASAFDSARMKAYTIVNLGVMRGIPTTLELSKQLGAAAPLLAGVPGFLLVGGGVALKRGDVVVGGLGIAGAPGGDLDQSCADAGASKIAGRLSP